IDLGVMAPYSCETCGRRFPRKLNLTKHQIQANCQPSKETAIEPAQTYEYPHVAWRNLSAGNDQNNEIAPGVAVADTDQPMDYSSDNVALFGEDAYYGTSATTVSKPQGAGLQDYNTPSNPSISNTVNPQPLSSNNSQNITSNGQKAPGKYSISFILQ
ncbi:MAG TPA: C2H2-type zinc finger protein, partial [Myxococcota bacterium]|nr:C2H2-type zinc finger protein [Myxococcota bacterium]